MSPILSTENSSRRRLGRRWKRRLRLVAPFMSLPLLIAVLILSVDLIEYRPEEKPSSPDERSIPPTVESAKADPDSAHLGDGRSLVGSGSPQARRVRPISPTALDLDLDLDLRLPDMEALRASPPPDALGGP